MDTREEILRLLREGLNQSEIATRLGISRQAVSKHVAKLKAEGLAPEPAALSAKTNAPEVNSRSRGAQPGNRNAVVTGEYEMLWDDGLTESERVAMRAAWQLPALDQVNRQLGLLDVRIGRALKRVERTRALIEAGVDMQAVGRVEVEVGKAGTLVQATTTSMHQREILERQEKAIDRMLQRRERLLALRVTIELKAAELKAAAEANASGPSNQFTVRFVGADG